MPTRINSNGVLEYIDDDFARSLAAEDVARAEALGRRFEQYGYLSQRDQEHIRACMDSAEDLLRQTNEYKDRPLERVRYRSTSDLWHAISQDDDELEPPTKEEVRERAQAVLNVYRKIARPAMETKTANYPLDPDTGMVTYASREVAEDE